MMRTAFRTAKDNEFLKWLSTLTLQEVCSLYWLYFVRIYRDRVKEYNKQVGTWILFYSNHGCLRAKEANCQKLALNT